MRGRARSNDRADHSNRGTTQTEAVYQTTQTTALNVIENKMIAGPKGMPETKRNIDLHLEDISHHCSVKGFYHIQNVFQRNDRCKVIGTLVNIQDEEIRKLYQFDQSKRPQTTLNEDFSEFVEGQQDQDQELPTQILWFSRSLDQKQNERIYQKPLMAYEKVQMCSVSEDYIVYVLERVDPRSEGQKTVEDVFVLKDTIQGKSPNQELFIIDIKNKRELKLKNPFENKVTALYIDENLLCLGSFVMLTETRLKDLFKDQKTEDFQKVFNDVTKEYFLPGVSNLHAEIYAFWHTKNSVNVEVFVKSLNSMKLFVYWFKTREGQERLQRRMTLTRIKTGGKDEQEEIQVFELKKTIDLEEENKLTKRRGTLRSLRTLSLVKEEISQNQPIEQQAQSDFSDSDTNSEASFDLSDEETKVEIKKAKETEEHLKYVKDEAQKKFNKLHGSLYVKGSLEEDQIGEILQAPVMTKAKSKQVQIKEQNEIEMKPLTHQRTYDKRQYQTFQRGNSPDGTFITEVRFHYRSTIVFRSDGQIDYITSDHQIYSSKNLDFSTMQVIPKRIAMFNSNDKQKKNPNIKNVFVEDGNLFISTEKPGHQDRVIYVFNFENLTLAKTKMTEEQAFLLPFQYKVQIVNQYLVYDNIVMISHGQFISMFDLNAQKCKEKPWRHLKIDERSSNELALMRNLSGNSENPFDSSGRAKESDSAYDPFWICQNDIRFMKIREQQGVEMPRIIVMFRNNQIRTLTRDTEMKWQFEQFGLKLLQGVITSVVQSVKASSLMLLRHKAVQNATTSSLSMFYFKDDEDLNRWKVLDNVQDYQRVFQVSLSNKFMSDLSRQKPLIGVYDDSARDVTIYKLYSEDEHHSQSSHPSLQKQQSSMTAEYRSANPRGGYGTFQPRNVIQNFRMLENDIIIESGNEDFVYLARDNTIFRFFMTDQALDDFIDANPNLAGYQSPHINMVPFVSIESSSAKHLTAIEDFRVFDTAEGLYVYASSKYNFYFNSAENFGKLYSRSELLPPTIAKNTATIYADENYGNVAMFTGPSQIMIVPFLHSNRISLKGAHHQPAPVFYELRGREDMHMLTMKSEIKTWNMITGKLKSCTKLDHNRYKNFKRINYFRGRTLICRQNQKDMMYTYLLVELKDRRTLYEHAKIYSEDYMSPFVNTKNTLFYAERVSGKRTVCELTRFDNNTGQIKNTVKTFPSQMPLQFLSPSFDQYIYVEQHTQKVKVKDIRTDITVCTLPGNLIRRIHNKDELFKTDDLVDHLVFIDEDLILIELACNIELVYQVSEQRVVSWFNKLNEHFHFNHRFFPKKHILEMSKTSRNYEEKVWHSDAATPHTVVEGQIHKPTGKLPLLQDLMYLNHKRYRHQIFIQDNALATVVRDKEGRNDDFSLKQHKLISVLPFSYAIWKLIDDLATERSVKVQDLTSEQMAAACFAILPKSYFSRIQQLERKRPDEYMKFLREAHKKPQYETLLHKMTARNPEGIKYLLHRMKKEWPTLYVPITRGDDGIAPLKLAYNNKDRRVVDWLLEHLQDYPIGYCQHHVAKLIPELIGWQFETRIGQYLNKRCLAPEWTSDYEVGRLVLNAQNMNTLSINNWMADTEDLDKKLFDDKKPKVPIKMEMLDLPNIHSYCAHQQRDKLLLNLVNCDIMIFSNRAVQAIIEYKWETARPVLVKRLLLPFLFYLIVFMVYLEILFNNTMDEHVNVQIYQFMVQGVLLLFAFYFLFHHIALLKMRQSEFFTMAMLWSMVDMVPLLANVVSVGLFAYYQDLEIGLLYQRPIYGFATMFLWLKVFYFVRIYRDIGHLVRLIFNVMYQMRFFFAVFFMFVIAFSTSFYALTTQDGNSGYVNSLTYVYFLTIRKAETDSFQGAEQEVLLWFTFVVTSLFFTYIMLNLTVSMVKLLYDQNMRIKTEGAYQVMCQLTLDCLNKISIPYYEQKALPPKEHEFVSDFCGEPNMDSNFIVKLRKDSFCTQYLLVASAAKEDFSGGIEKPKEAAEQISALATQVNHGFKSLRSQMNQKNHFETQEDIASYVDQKIEEATQEQNKELRALKEQNAEILRLLKAQADKCQ